MGIRKTGNILRIQGNKDPKKKIEINQELPVISPVITKNDFKNTAKMKNEQNELLAEIKNDLETPETSNEDNQNDEKLTDLQNLMGTKLEREPPEKELYKDKIIRTTTKSVIPLKQIFFIIMLITVASGA